MNALQRPLGRGLVLPYRPLPGARHGGFRAWESKPLVTIGRQLTQVSEPYQPAAFLVPQSPGQGLDAFEDREQCRLSELPVLHVATLQPVVGYVAAHVMDMVEADVSREPL